MTTAFITKALQSKLASSGLDWVKLESFALNSRDKTMNMEVTLEGEDTPVKVEVRYSLGAENVIVVREVVTSRRWMTETIKLVLVKTGNRFDLPGGLQGKMLRVLL